MTSYKGIPLKSAIKNVKVIIRRSDSMGDSHNSESTRGFTDVIPNDSRGSRNQPVISLMIR